MNRFIYAIVALVLILSLAACTVGDITDQTTSTTVSSVTTHITTTTDSGNVSDVTTTTVEDGSNMSDTTTTTTEKNETTTTTKKTEHTTSSGAKMYENHPNVPDYGAMLGVTHSYSQTSGNQNDSTGRQKVCFYFYDVNIISRADPNAQSRVQYINLLSEYGYKPAGTLTDEKNNLTYYGYENEEQRTIVLMSAIPTHIIIGVVNY